MPELTYHVVPPDIPVHDVVGVLSPAHPDIPQPGLAGEGPHPVEEDGGVEDEPPGALAELGGGGRHVGSPLVSEPALNLHQNELFFKRKKIIFFFNPKSLYLPTMTGHLSNTN